MHAPDRQAVVDRILADPPVVHPMDASADPVMGVWSTEESCYRFLADRCPPGTRTLETGSGLSTVLLAALGAEHICCTPGPEEVARVEAYCTDRDIPVDRLRFEVGSSHRTLPPLEAAGVVRDLVLVDGSHGFPFPHLDWFYAANLLPPGGVLIVDDLHLPASRELHRFLRQDPRWVALGGSSKWGAWERRSDGDLAEDWTEQPFFVSTGDRLRAPFRKVVGKLRKELGRFRR